MQTGRHTSPRSNDAPPERTRLTPPPPPPLRQHSHGFFCVRGIRLRCTIIHPLLTHSLPRRDDCTLPVPCRIRRIRNRHPTHRCSWRILATCWPMPSSTSTSPRPCARQRERRRCAERRRSAMMITAALPVPRYRRCWAASG